MKYNRDYINTGFKVDLKYYSDLITTNTAVTEDHIQNLEYLQTKISDSRFQFDELVNEVKVMIQDYNSKKIRQDKVIRLAEINQRRTEIDSNIKEYDRISKNKNILGWSSAGASALSTCLFGIFFFLSDESYDNYQSATITADAVAYKDEFQTYDTISYIALGAGLVGAGVSAYSFMSKPSAESLSIEYTSLGIEMARLEGELQ